MQLFRILLHGWRRRACYGTPPEQQERRALTWYFASTLLGTLMSLFGKLCASAGMHFFLLVCVRSSVLCLLVAPLLWRRRLNPFALNEAFPLLLLRGFCGFASMSLWYLSLQLLPLSDANSLGFVSPVLVAIAAPRLLGEPTPRAVYCAAPFCLAGMLLVAQPTWLFGGAAGATSQLGVAAGLLQALFSTGSKLAIRALNKHQEPLESILFSMGLISALGAAAGCLALPGPQLAATAARGAAWLYLGVTSLLAFVCQWVLTAALQQCNASQAASLDYLTLLWTLLADALVFRKLPSTLSMAGSALIAAASLAALLWGATHGGDGDGPPEAAAAQPLAFKQQHYLASGPGGQGGARSTCEAEAVSLLQAAAGDDAAAAVAAKEAAAAAALRGDCPASDKHAGKLALAAAALTDSSKSWRLGTEVEALAAGCQPAAGLPAGGAADGAASMELQAVPAGPAGMRTSSEKEQALQAAGR